MCNKLIAGVTILIALILAIAVSVLSPEHLDWVIIISRFFEIMVPILAVGALLRYLTYCPHATVFNKVLAYCFVLIALIVAIIGEIIVKAPAYMDWLVFLSRFFEVMLPILAVGALLKYLTSCQKKTCED